MAENKPLLSVCLIIRDSGKYLEKCLTLVCGIVDEIVVVDTGSKDNTLEIARRFTSNIHFFKWVDDFSAAKNYALEKASGEWILSINVDEYLMPVSQGYLKNILSKPDVIAYSCGIRYTKGYTVEDGNLWLFRNDPRIRFNGILHENISKSLEIFLSSGEYKIGHCDLTLDHVGWDGDSAMKYDRDLKLLKKELEVFPKSGMLWNRVALIYHHTNEWELAKSINEKALNLVRKSNQYLPVEANVFALAIQIGFTDNVHIEAIVDEALDHYPGNPTFLYSKAKLLIGSKEFEQAVALFRQLLILGETDDFDHAVSHPLNIFDELACDGIASCYFKMKQYLRASEFYQKAILHNDKKEYRVKNSLCIGLAN